MRTYDLFVKSEAHIPGQWRQREYGHLCLCFTGRFLNMMSYHSHSKPNPASGSFAFLQFWKPRKSIKSNCTCSLARWIWVRYFNSFSTWAERQTCREVCGLQQSDKSVEILGNIKLYANEWRKTMGGSQSLWGEGSDVCHNHLHFA